MTSNAVFLQKKMKQDDFPEARNRNLIFSRNMEEELLTKKKLRDLVTQIHPNERLESDAEAVRAQY